MYPAHAPMILVFQITAVAPTIDLHGNGVFARLNEVGDIEFRRQSTVLGVSYLPTIDPHEVGRRHAAEVQDNLLVLPVLGDLELASVRPHGIVGLRDPGRIRGKRVARV